MRFYYIVLIVASTQNLKMPKNIRYNKVMHKAGVKLLKIPKGIISQFI